MLRAIGAKVSADWRRWRSHLQNRHDVIQAAVSPPPLPNTLNRGIRNKREAVASASMPIQPSLSNPGFFLLFLVW